MTSWKLEDVREPIERLVIRGGRELTVTIRVELAMPSASSLQCNGAGGSSGLERAAGGIAGEHRLSGISRNREIDRPPPPFKLDRRIIDRTCERQGHPTRDRDGQRRDNSQVETRLLERIDRVRQAIDANARAQDREILGVRSAAAGRRTEDGNSRQAGRRNIGCRDRDYQLCTAEESRRSG